MGIRGCEPEIPKINKKFYDIIELVYILNKLSDKKYMDERTRQYLISILKDIDFMKYKFDNYRCKEPSKKIDKIGCNNYDYFNPDNKNSFMDQIIFFLKSLNDED
ncbi:hypothetical protein [Sedimentibacter sp.]|uniref:hypothetical protein n=1 Tax=Sedimentibacter sp. TaxID=1960295 RepID=UPI0028AD9BDE|nr:hypothetical protein [Sedimentibacter sp.]